MALGGPAAPSRDDTLQTSNTNGCRTERNTDIRVQTYPHSFGLTSSMIMPPTLHPQTMQRQLGPVAKAGASQAQGWPRKCSKTLKHEEVVYW